MVIVEGSIFTTVVCTVEVVMEEVWAKIHHRTVEVVMEGPGEYKKTLALLGTIHILPQAIRIDILPTGSPADAR